jgi:hypothetical protein
MMINIPDQITNFIQDIESQIHIQKETFQNMILNDTKPLPMVVLYKNPDSPYVSVVSPLANNFEDTIKNVTSALHLYPTIPACGCYVTLTSQYLIDDHNYPALNIFIMSKQNAYTLTIPYSLSDNGFVWLDDHSFISQVDDQDLDETGRNIISSFFLFVNSSGLPFTTEEVLSYMTTTGHSFMFHDQSSIPKYLSISDPF